MIDNGGDAMRVYDTRERESEIKANSFVTCGEEKRDLRRMKKESPLGRKKKKNERK